MNTLSGTALVLAFHAIFFVPHRASAETLQADRSAPVWQSAKAEHIYGFSELKPHIKGTLAVSPDSVTFWNKAGKTSIDRYTVTAVSAGNQRVELWGVTGRLIRMAIPQGGGLAASTVMHHRVDMLTVEYRDQRGAVHGAVFFLPAHQADQALQRISQLPAPCSSPEAVPEQPVRTALDVVPDCQDSVEARSVLVAAPNWDETNVPAAYRALVYEHVVDRLRRTEGAGRVYRDGENNVPKVCPQYTIHISVTGFKQGSQVTRAMLGPVGMFVGTTQMKFDTALSDTSGSVDLHKQIKGSTRGESESTGVADSIAKSIAKQYAGVLKDANKKVIAQVDTGRKR